jgi:8-oxo-dGTP pyrophosphatase MutT (NUDIX family)
MKKLSAGIFITKGDEILLGHATGSRRYDIPKGLVEEGEDVKETAVRECFEEFGIKVPKNELTDLGQFKYLSGKDLHLFRWEVEDFPELSKLKCTSYFINHRGKELPEIDGYKIFKIEEAKEVVAKGLVKIMDKELQENYNESILRKAVNELK